MNCPNCSVPLDIYTYKEIEVDKCPRCGGMWFEYEELDELEDMAYEVDDQKGSLIHREVATDMKCPNCEKPLKGFQYRLYNMHLEYCEDMHGFWLDAGEEIRILELMKQREGDIERKIKAEAEWARTLRRFRRKSFLNKLLNMF